MNTFIHCTCFANTVPPSHVALLNRFNSLTIFSLFERGWKTVESPQSVVFLDVVPSLLLRAMTLSSRTIVSVPPSDWPFSIRDGADDGVAESLGQTSSCNTGQQTH